MFVLGAVGVSVVGAFAIVSNQPAESQLAGGSLEDVIESRETWDVALPEWSGRAAPDFTVTDVHGAEHRLSDYRGRNVLLVFIHIRHFISDRAYQVRYFFWIFCNAYCFF